MGPLFQFSNNTSILFDFRQDIGYKLEFAVTSSPSRGKMFFSFELGYDTIQGLEMGEVFFDYGIRMGATF